LFWLKNDRIKSKRVRSLKRRDVLKIWAFLAAAFVLSFSIESGPSGFRLIGYSPTEVFAICSGLCVFYLTILYFAAEGTRRLLVKKWPVFGNWVAKLESRNNGWIGWCYRKGYWGLLIASFFPHAELAGVAAQKLLRLKYGYWMLVIGTVAKAAAWTFGGIRIFEYIVKCIQNI
jgi:hypothetical protein